jgi:hypothetical protein
MALQSSGPISFSQINTELGVASNTTISIGSASSRGLSGVASGQTGISNFYGKANRVAISYTYSATTANASLNVTSIAGYIAGKSDITINVNSGVYLYATTSANAGLTLSGGTTGDTVTLVNNGFIIGQGGKGSDQDISNGTAGGNALTLGYPTRITNNSYIAGGGGGGGGAAYGARGSGGGGGGAGGGAGGRTNPTSGVVAGGAGGGPGATGSNGSGNGTISGNQIPYGGGSGGGGGAYVNLSSGISTSGAGGGRILPGTGGAGSVGAIAGTNAGSGGSANNVGGNGNYASNMGSAGGGGGWGAAGGAGRQSSTGATNPGSAGGKAIHLNGHSVTWLTTGTVYGAVS